MKQGAKNIEGFLALNMLVARDNSFDKLSWHSVFKIA